jgi:hypothetical protein
MSLCTLLPTKEEDWRRRFSFSPRWRRIRGLLVQSNHCPLVVLVCLPVGRAEEWEAGVGADDAALLRGCASSSGGTRGLKKGSVQVFVRLLLCCWCT